MSADETAQRFQTFLKQNAREHSDARTRPDGPFVDVPVQWVAAFAQSELADLTRRNAALEAQVKKQAEVLTDWLRWWDMLPVGRHPLTVVEKWVHAPAHKQTIDKTRAALSPAPATPDSDVARQITAADIRAWFVSRPGCSWVASINDIDRAVAAITAARAIGLDQKQGE